MLAAEPEQSVSNAGGWMKSGNQRQRGASEFASLRNRSSRRRIASAFCRNGPTSDRNDRAGSSGLRASSSMRRARSSGCEALSFAHGAPSSGLQADGSVHRAQGSEFQARSLPRRARSSVTPVRSLVHGARNSTPRDLCSAVPCFSGTGSTRRGNAPAEGAIVSSRDRSFAAKPGNDAIPGADKACFLRIEA